MNLNLEKEAKQLNHPSQNILIDHIPALHIPELDVERKEFSADTDCIAKLFRTGHLPKEAYDTDHMICQLRLPAPEKIKEQEVLATGGIINKQSSEIADNLFRICGQMNRDAFDQLKISSEDGIKGGTYTLTVNGKTSRPIPFYASLKEANDVFNDLFERTISFVIPSGELYTLVTIEDDTFIITNVYGKSTPPISINATEHEIRGVCFKTYRGLVPTQLNPPSLKNWAVAQGFPPSTHDKIMKILEPFRSKATIKTNGSITATSGSIEGWKVKTGSLYKSININDYAHKV